MNSAYYNRFYRDLDLINEGQKMKYVVSKIFEACDGRPRKAVLTPPGQDWLADGVENMQVTNPPAAMVVGDEVEVEHDPE